MTLAKKYKRNIIYLSTGHLRPETIAFLEEYNEQPISAPFQAYQLNEPTPQGPEFVGFLILPLINEPSGLTDNVPADLQTILDSCRKENISAIIFDRDADIIPEYPDYSNLYN